MGSEEFKKLGYMQLKDLEIELDMKDDFFTLCFWIYLPNYTPFPSTILHQSHSFHPFLGLDKDKKLIFSPAIEFTGECDLDHSVPRVISEMEFPLQQWVHLGCEVCSNVIRIYLDGNTVGEKVLNSLHDGDTIFYSNASLLLFAMFQNEHIDGHVYNVEVLPSTLSINNHHAKDPPLQLCVDSGSLSDVELEKDGIWNIVGGKVSCRKIFSLDILLLDAFGQPVHREMKVVASLIYADDWSLVEKPDDNEAALLAISDGLEFPSGILPSKLVQGRASFKMKISQLSSKCDDKLFRIIFHVPELGNQPFLEAFTPPIRCISKTSNTNVSTVTWKKLPSGVHLFNGSSSPQHGAGPSELHQKGICETRPNPPSKRVKFGQDTPMDDTEADTSVKNPEEECNSYKVPEDMVTSAPGTSLGCIQENYASDSESDGTKSSELKSMPCVEELLSDLTIFRYCSGACLRDRLCSRRFLYLRLKKISQLWQTRLHSFLDAPIIGTKS